MGQHLTMTTQLQQAIRLLQLSTIELQQEIQNALDSNPLLEVSDDDHNTLTTAANSASESSNETSSDNHQQDDYETEASSTSTTVARSPIFASGTVATSPSPRP